MKIISSKICPFVQRVVGLLEAKNLDYEVEYVSLRQPPDWFPGLSPHGQVPVLVTDTGRPLFESEAIVEYLEEAYPPLQQGLTLETKASNRAWGYLAAKNYLVQCSTQRSPDEQTLMERKKKLDAAFDRIEEQLRGSPFFNSDTPGHVDLAWLPILHRANIVERLAKFDFIGDRPKLKAWQQTILDSDLPKASVAEDFERIFTDFYLADTTYLGRGWRGEKTPESN